MEVKSVFNALSEECQERVLADVQSEPLKDQFAVVGVLEPVSKQDAHHVALSTASDCAVIVSWNFKHIVNFR